MDVCLAALDGLQECVMEEDVLLLCLHKEVALRPDVLEETEDVQLSLGPDHLHHRVEDDVGARSTHAGAGKGEQISVTLTRIFSRNDCHGYV